MLTLRKELKAARSVSLPDTSARGAYECVDPESGQVLDQEQGFFADSGFLLADGRFFLFVDNRTPGMTTGVSELMMVPLNLATGHLLGAPRRIRSFNARFVTSLTASSSGSRLVSVLDRVETDVFTANLRPGSEFRDVVRLTRGLGQSYPHAWTADGKSVLFESDALTPSGSPAKWSIYDEPLDEPKARLIISQPESAAMPQLSPDGRLMLFLEFTGVPQHAIGVFRIPATGGLVEQVPTRGHIEEFHCSNIATGRCVLRVTIGNEQLVYYALDPVQGMGQELARTPWRPNRLGDWGLSADGDTVATANHDASNPGISLLSLRSGLPSVREIALRQHGTTLGANWASDGKSLFVECKTERGFELVNLDRFFFHVIASLAEMERELIVERARAGLEVARLLGRTGGSKRQMTATKVKAEEAAL